MNIRRINILAIENIFVLYLPGRKYIYENFISVWSSFVPGILIEILHN